MPILPPSISQVFVQVLTGRRSIAAFEQWVYSTPELETYLSADDYLELISISYSGPEASQDVHWVLERYVDWGELQREELLGALRAIAVRTSPDEVVHALLTCYEWYCRGCRFLEELALGFGVEADEEYGWGRIGSDWQSLSTTEKEAYVAAFYPAVQREAEQVARWLTAGLIRFEHQPYLSRECRIYYVDTRPEASAGEEPDDKSADPNPPTQLPHRQQFRQRRNEMGF